MLGLVVATNIFRMYIFRELVGVSSYLLIGFFYKLPSAVSASKKAFIVTRFADLGFLIGILVLSFYTNTFNFAALTSDPASALASTGGATFMGASVLTWALVLIYVGGMGKSAMMPLHIWLPDAMEGPTPVSALIHAATMVVAGVYLVARMFPLYLVEESALTFITCVGAITAFYAAVVACCQIDIKRILAFSTISQIAFMMVALGVARPELHDAMGYMSSMFHLFTHAMFKALLFLGAGACPDSRGAFKQLYGNGRSAQVYAHHSLDIPYRLSCDCRYLAVRWLLLERRDACCNVCEQLDLGCLDDYGCRSYCILYVPYVFYGFLVGRESALQRTQAARRSLADVSSFDRSCDS